MAPPNCALCYASIDVPSSAITTGDKCKHSFHAICLKIRFQVETSRAATDRVRSCCPICTRDETTAIGAEIQKISTLLVTMNTRLGAFEATAAKVSTLVTVVEDLRGKFDSMLADNVALKSGLETVNATVTEVKKDVDSLAEVASRHSAEISEIGSKLAIRQTGVLAPADEAMLLRVACNEVANQLIITGIQDGGDRERLDEILTKLLAALNIQLPPDAIIRFEQMGRYRAQSAPGASTLRLDATAPGSPPAFTARPLL